MNSRYVYSNFFKFHTLPQQRFSKYFRVAYSKNTKKLLLWETLFNFTKRIRSSSQTQLFSKLRKTSGTTSERFIFQIRFLSRFCIMFSSCFLYFRDISLERLFSNVKILAQRQCYKNNFLNDAILIFRKLKLKIIRLSKNLEEEFSIITKLMKDNSKDVSECHVSLIHLLLKLSKFLFSKGD